MIVSLFKVLKMLKIYFLLVVFSIVLISCSNNDTWQWTFYPNWCLNCNENTQYSPVFDNYSSCKQWVLNKASNRDLYSCDKNCTTPNGFWIRQCEEIVRNWKPVLESVIFEEYEWN